MKIENVSIREVLGTIHILGENIIKNKDFTTDKDWNMEKEYDSDLSRCKRGDHIWTIQEGWTKVTRIKGRSAFPVVANGISYTTNGAPDVTDKYPSAFVTPPSCFNPGAKPVEPRYKVLSAVALMSQLIARGYHVDSMGFWSHGSECVHADAWQDCGKEVNPENWANWMLEEVDE